MSKKNWIKTGLLTSALIALAAPAIAQRPDGGGNGRSDQRNHGDSSGSRGGDNRGGDNRGGDNRAGGWSRSAPGQNSPAQATNAPPTYGRPRDTGFGPRPGVGSSPAPAFHQVPQSSSSGSMRDGRQYWSGDQGRSGNDHDQRGAQAQDRNDNRQGDWNRDRRDQGRADARPGDRNWNEHDRNDRDRNDRSWNDRDWGDRSGGRDWRYTPGRSVTDRWDGFRRWDNDWRRDRRYDWEDWRRDHRSYYHLPRYYAPFGWTRGYSRFSIGVYINSILFSSTYWIDDPYYYRLPPAYGPLRWIRYYDDALLVDIRDGYVVDVVYDVFW